MQYHTIMYKYCFIDLAHHLHWISDVASLPTPPVPSPTQWVFTNGPSSTQIGTSPPCRPKRSVVERSSHVLPSRPLEASSGTYVWEENPDRSKLKDEKLEKAGTYDCNILIYVGIYILIYTYNYFVYWFTVFVCLFFLYTNSNLHCISITTASSTLPSWRTPNVSSSRSTPSAGVAPATGKSPNPQMKCEFHQPLGAFSVAAAIGPNLLIHQEMWYQQPSSW